MPTVPNLSPEQRAKLGQAEDERPTPERLLMTAADMHARGQLTQTPSSYTSQGADLRLPFAGGGRGTRPSGPHGKRR